jgi:hypothetical protein
MLSNVKNTMPTLLHIAVCNLSTVISHLDGMRMAAACAFQLKNHVAPAWNLGPVAVSFVVSAEHIMPGAEPIYILDDADQAGTLGYHDVDAADRPYAKIFAKTVLDNGGVTLHGPISVAVTLSHEMCEMYGDPSANAWARRDTNTSVALELCDAVEEDSYECNGASVSNFLLPAYFKLGKGEKLDYLNLCKAPFEIRHGGYDIVRNDTTGNVSQEFNDLKTFKNEAKKHVASRTFRRLQCQRSD